MDYTVFKAFLGLFFFGAVFVFGFSQLAQLKRQAIRDEKVSRSARDTDKP